FYNCIAPEFLVEAPPGGISWVLGSEKDFNLGKRLNPKSLYYQQVQDRLGKEALKHLVSEEQLENMGAFSWVEKRLEKEKITK
ncbi:MAG: hypothetical protein R3182_11655, partial [Draconibacterium sp.]|nr:hypothetical protein [Draconibacterium sp.]